VLPGKELRKKGETVRKNKKVVPWKMCEKK
jgi:hypothetical protein